MKKLTVLTILSILLFNVTFGQNIKKYYELVETAYSLYESKNYLESGKKYSEAFVLVDGGRLHDKYNAACSWALANKPDSAFNQLFIITKQWNYKDYEEITQDADFNSLHKHKKWKKLIRIVKKNKAKAEAKLDKRWHLMRLKPIGK